jgi:hypothetical protein
MDLAVTGLDGKTVAVHPDGLFRAADGTLRNVEIKSCDSHTFDRWLSNGGPSDDWGYRTQATMEVQAWRENGDEVNETVFVAVSTGSRQGSIAEWILPHEWSLYEAWMERRRLRQQPELPPVPYQPTPEMAFKRGKTIEAEQMMFGEPKPRTNDAGAIYGWDYPTGREIVGTVCTYCDFMKKCWPTATMELEGSKPVWVIPPPQSPLFTGPVRMDREAS